MKYKVFGAAPRVTKPTLIPWEVALKPHNPSGSMRIVAVTPDGERIPDGNLVKFKSDGTVYLYHTVNPQLGLALDRDGRIQLA